MATAALLRHRLRSLLAILGVGVGIAAVIATAGLGAGAARRVDQQINALGEDFLWIRAGNRNLGGVRTGSGGARTLTIADAQALAASIPTVTMCSPRETGREQIIIGNQNWNTSYRGVSADFFDIRDRALALGTQFTAFDETTRARVLVLGETVAERLFGEADPIGQSVRMGRFFFRVIGVLASKGTSRGGLDRDDAVFLPISTVQHSLSRRPWIDDIMCSVASPGAMSAAQADVTALLRERHAIAPGAPDDFEIQQPLEFLQMRAQATGSLQMLLVAIGAVSLVVGGIGIMNIMLVSVAERRREIGIRLAIGARVRDIRGQFLIEAAAIGLLGGVAGAALGYAAASGLSAVLGAAVIISPSLLGWVTIAAVGAGLLFGYLPAHRASSLDPIEAMKTES